MSEIQPSTTADVNNLATRYLGKTEVWKFGYGSNMGQEFLRTKKKLNPIQFACSILHGYSLSFPEGKGFDFVEPSFATTKIDPNGCIHGVSTLLSIECAEKLNKQEGVGNGGYNLEICKVELYDGSELEVEVYVPSKPLPFDFPEGCCSIRYRDILVTGAKEANLHPEWITKLENLKIYTPSDETLAKRSKLPPLSSLPVMSIAELALYNGTSEEYPHHISTCGYIFKLKDMFNVYHGRDVTFRFILQFRGINLDANDDGGKSPFPVLSKVEPPALEHALRYRDRCIHRSGDVGPVAVLKEFWEEQEPEVEGLFVGNTLSKL